MSDKNWIGVDLDGTLAEYHGMQSHTHIGPPVTKMVERVLSWIKAGKRVKIVTERVYPGYPHSDECREAIEHWVDVYIGYTLDVTWLKTPCMIEFWGNPDQRVIQVITNTGERLYSSYQKSSHLFHTWCRIRSICPMCFIGVMGLNPVDNTEVCLNCGYDPLVSCLDNHESTKGPAPQLISRDQMCAKLADSVWIVCSVSDSVFYSSWKKDGQVYNLYAKQNKSN